MPVELWFAFVVASAFVLVIPGPTILTVIGYAMAHGRRATVPLVAAVALGDCTSLAVSLLGLGALLAASAFWFGVVKLAGGAYLVWLGLAMVRNGMAASELRLPAAPASRRRLFLNTWLVTALNPKGIVFFAAFLPQFVDPAAAPGRQLWILAATFVAMAIVNATLYAAFAAAAARRLLAAPRAQRRVNLAGGALLAGAGAWALLLRRGS